MNTSATEMFDNISFLKVICLAFIPIIIILVSSILYLFLFIRDMQKVKRMICITMITAFFLFYPALAQYGLMIFKCSDIGGGNMRVQMDVQQV
jgi:amino acid permease